jgi:DNA-binding MarR family transcriptional regulator
MQSQALLRAYQLSPRVSSTFATQQRWLLAHVGLALHFEREEGGLGITNSRFLERVLMHRVASRNTADAFIKEMQKYGIIRLLPDVEDRRVRPMEPAEAAIDALAAWTVAHLATLDRLDGGSRAERFMAEPDGLRRLQPRIADGLLRSPAIRNPVRTVSLFTWLNNGGVIMDWLIAGLDPDHPEAERYSTPVTSVTELAGWMKLSRTHLSRKLRQAEALGSIGWLGPHGKSGMWVSAGFVREMLDAQAEKLAVIDAAFAEVFGPPEP